jgi:aspartyl-tRNA(Asn)/glutamyl-tRNA(Gln) amidotransferase subunit B
VGEGALTLDLEDGSTKAVGIERVHLEQDAGKSLHDQDPRRTYVDLNRAGVALMEIVSKPDLRSADEAGAYLAKLRSILRYLGTCDGDMEKGNLRADVNVSVRRAGASEYGTRCEIKNVNSIRFVKQAVEFEARRQIDVLEDGGKIDQETRLFDSARGETRPMRSKEEAHDYRYFPDPDLLPLVLEQKWVDAIKSGLPELPDAKKERFMRAYGLSAYDAGVLVAEKEVADAYEAKVKATVELRRKDAKTIEDESVVVQTSAAANANIIVNQVFGIAKQQEEEASVVIERTDSPGAIYYQIGGVISGRMLKEVVEESARTGKPARQIIDERGFRQISDEGAIEAEVDKVIAANPAQVAKYKAGETKVAGWFVGQVMKATGGKANPQIVNQLLAKKLGG